MKILGQTKKKNISIILLAMIIFVAMTSNYQVKAAIRSEDIQALIDGGETNITLEDDVVGNIVIPSGKTVTLNLNGHFIKGEAVGTNLNSSVPASGTAINGVMNATITNKGTLTIKGSGRVVAGGQYDAALVNTSSGTANLQGGSFEDAGTGGWFVVQNLGRMTVSGSTVIENRTGAYAGLLNGVDETCICSGQSITGYSTGTANLTVSGGTIKGINTALKNGDKFAKATITGGTIRATSSNNSSHGVIVNSNNMELKITGGTLTSSGLSPIVRAEVKSYGTSGAGVTISGGTFKCTEGDCIQVVSNASGVSPVVNVSGGSFTGNIAKSVENNNTSGLSLTGGTYSDGNIDSYVASDRAIYSSDGLYTIGKKSTAVVAESVMVLVGDSGSIGELDDAFREYAVTNVGDSNVAEVSNGTVTGKASGVTTVSSSITTIVGGNASTDTKNTEVVVYDVVPSTDSNLDKAANESVRAMVKEFVNNGKADGLNEVSKDSLKSVLVDGGVVKTEVSLKEVEAKDVLDDALAIDKLIGEGAKAARYYKIEIVLKSGDDVVANVTTLKSPISLTLNIPSDIKEVEEGYVRQYSVVRIHDGQAEIIDSKYDETVQTLTVESDKFSTYGITYKDVLESEANTDEVNGEHVDVSEDTVAAEDEPRTIYNPKTGDIIACIGAILIFASAGFALSKLNKAKNNLK